MKRTKRKLRCVEGDRLRLFALRCKDDDTLYSNDRGEPIFFSSKRQAKVARDQVNYDSPLTFVVILGPDHRRARAGGSYEDL